MRQSYESTGAADAGGPPHVLVVDDDPTVAEVVAGYLLRAGCTVDRAGDGPSALARAHTHRPDLVVLDLMLPGMDGLEVCRRMRARHPVPVIMLTARGDEDDRILGLERGADDYVTKPFSPRELVLRVESVLRRTRPDPAPDPVRLGRLALDPAARLATRDGTPLSLTLREFDLLAFFLRHPGRAYSREELMREVWGWEFGDLSTVTVHIRRLRAKIEDDPAAPRAIRTVWGVGYRFEAEETVEETEEVDGTGGSGPGEAGVTGPGATGPGATGPGMTGPGEGDGGAGRHA
ncbi:phosphate regulon transcriptional regulatory protein PhoB [Streptomyces sp. SPB78]|uniref:response regulator transcription factor n=1 Tax=Streptomyces sp. (strain SPB78) TaxID=591157 RepID=UPI0001B53880|nr:response regulator transcription factor [Streptomyces sp. SPB78]EFK99924.1 phosphate regulon transcriptional regulatory protein PhoB [Streptomyces sp. SPB78]